MPKWLGEMRSFAPGHRVHESQNEFELSFLGFSSQALGVSSIQPAGSGQAQGSAKARTVEG